MHMVKKEVLLDINGRNDHIAQHVKEHLEERHIAEYIVHQHKYLIT